MRDWSFVKLEFKRTIIDPRNADDQKNADKPLMESAPTPGLWCQLAADFSRFAVAGGQEIVYAQELLVDRRAMLRGGTSGPAFVRKVDGKAVALAPYQAPFAGSVERKEKGSRLVVALWVVATARLTDASESEVERYFGVYTLSGELLVPADQSPPLAGVDSKLVFRVLEVESLEPLAEPGLARLWPPAGDWDATRAPDAAARIVKVSRPIERKP